MVGSDEWNEMVKITQAKNLHLRNVLHTTTFQAKIEPIPFILFPFNVFLVDSNRGLMWWIIIPPWTNKSHFAQPRLCLSRYLKLPKAFMGETRGIWFSNTSVEMRWLKVYRWSFSSFEPTSSMGRAGVAKQLKSPEYHATRATVVERAGYPVSSASLHEWSYKVVAIDEDHFSWDDDMAIVGQRTHIEPKDQWRQSDRAIIDEQVSIYVPKQIIRLREYNKTHPYFLTQDHYFVTEARRAYTGFHVDFLIISYIVPLWERL